MMTRSVPASGCTPAPSPVTEFYNDETSIYLYFTIQNARAGDEVRAAFFKPGGRSYTDYTWAPLREGGNWCFKYKLELDAEAKQATGEWRVTGMVSGKGVFELTFKLFDRAAPPAAATISRYMMTRALPESGCTPYPTPATDFYTSESSIYLFFTVDGARTGDTLRAVFLKPDATTYSTTDWTPISDPGDWCMSLRLTLDDEVRRSTGEWRVKGYLNGGDAFSLSFRLLDRSGAAPLISGVGQAFSGERVVAPGAFFSIYGQKLAPAAVGQGRVWQEFRDGRLPTSIEGVRVKVNGKPAYIAYVSPVQINAIAPGDTGNARDVSVEVTTPDGTSAPATVKWQPYAPGFLCSGAEAGKRFIFGMNGPARPGDPVVLYGTGFGQTDPEYRDGVLPSSYLPEPAYLPLPAGKLKVRFGDAEAPVDYAGLTSFPGLYQINVRVPDSVTDGNAPVVAEIGGFPSPATEAYAKITGGRPAEPPVQPPFTSETGSFELKIYEAYRFSDRKVVKSDDKTADVKFSVSYRSLAGATMPVSYFSAQNHLKFFGDARPDASKVTASEVHTWKASESAIEPGYYLLESASGDRYYLVRIEAFENQGKATAYWLLKCSYERVQVAQ